MRYNFSAAAAADYTYTKFSISIRASIGGTIVDRAIRGLQPPKAPALAGRLGPGAAAWCGSAAGFSLSIFRTVKFHLVTFYSSKYHHFQNLGL